MDFKSTGYLASGTPKQQAVFQLIRSFSLFEILKSCDPLLAGTIPLSIDTDSSDIDIICTIRDQNEFINCLNEHFRTFPDYELSVRDQSVVCRFKLNWIPVEIYGENKKSEDQFAFRHMLIEDRILKLADRTFKERVVALKTQGIKTEPAFVHLLHLDEQDPYQSLLSVETMSDQELMQLIRSVGF